MFKTKNMGDASATLGTVARGEENLTLIFLLCIPCYKYTYCIDMTTLGSDIYMYMKGKIYKKP
jgi:hypothetical protein